MFCLFFFNTPFNLLTTASDTKETFFNRYLPTKKPILLQKIEKYKKKLLKNFKNIKKQYCEIPTSTSLNRNSKNQ
jgi:hypothetical protein